LRPRTAYLTGLPEKVVAIGGLLVRLSQIWFGYDLLRIPGKSAFSE